MIKDLKNATLSKPLRLVTTLLLQTIPGCYPLPTTLNIYQGISQSPPNDVKYSPGDQAPSVQRLK